MAKGIWLYVQVILTITALVTGIGVFQAAVNAHDTLSLLGGLLTLLGLPVLVAFFCKQISNQLN